MPLRPLSWCYGLGMIIRNWCYDAGVFRSNNVRVPVISVGNITAGGTGKTPIVEYIVSRLLASGKRIAVVSRGYKRITHGTFIVSDGTRCFGGPQEAGDEPMQLARKFPTATVVVDEQRSRGAEAALRLKEIDAIVLDDGFQHRALGRDLDIVVMDGSESVMGEPMIPSGLRREPFPALRRAGIVVVTRNQISERMRTFIRNYTPAPLVCMMFKPLSLTEAGSNERLRYQDLKGKRCIAFCGIGNPRSFVVTLGEAGIRPLDTLFFPDHHAYSPADIQTIVSLAKRCDAAILMTTEKDAVRLDQTLLSRIDKSLRLLALTIGAEIMEGEESFHRLLDAALRRAA